MRSTASSKIQKNLTPDEGLLWWGQPDRGLNPDVGLVVVILALLFWTGFVAVVAVRHGAGVVSPKIAILIGTVILGWWLIAYLVVFLPRITFYGLSTRRVLIIDGLFRRNVQSLPLRMMARENVRLEERGARFGTIYFDDFTQKCGYQNAGDICMPKFFQITDARRVAEAIKAAITRLPAGSAHPADQVPFRVKRCLC